MIKILIFVIFIVLVVKCRYVRIKWWTFLKKGFAPKRGKFGVYCYCGKQGQGKTYSVVEYLLQNKDKKIYSNITSLQGVEYTPIGDFDDLLRLNDEHDCIIVFDEIFTALSRHTSSKIWKEKCEEVMSFLSQMRKRRIIFLTTAQEWLEIDITLRRYCRYQIDCEMRRIFCFGILLKRMYDAEQMKWSNEANEYVAPLQEITLSKCNYYVANSYDTYEEIKTAKKK